MDIRETGLVRDDLKRMLNRFAAPEPPNADAAVVELLIRSKDAIECLRDALQTSEITWERRLNYRNLQEFNQKKEIDRLMEEIQILRTRLGE